MSAAGADLRGWWERHDGLDGGIRFVGAFAVVVTIEVLAGYYLWRGTTESVLIPPALGWALQFGLTGGSVVGTRAFHRGQSEDKWWGLVASIFAVLCVVADASVAALLLNGLVHLNAGWLAVGVLVECLVIGYLTVHTLMARPRSKSTSVAETLADRDQPADQSRPVETTVVEQDNQDDHTVEMPRVDETTLPAELDQPEPEPVRPQLTSVGWSVDQIVADLHAHDITDPTGQYIRKSYSCGKAKADKVLAALHTQEVAS